METVSCQTKPGAQNHTHIDDCSGKGGDGGRALVWIQSLYSFSHTLSTLQQYFERCIVCQHEHKLLQMKCERKHKILLFTDSIR